MSSEDGASTGAKTGFGVGSLAFIACLFIPGCIDAATALVQKVIPESALASIGITGHDAIVAADAAIFIGATTATGAVVGAVVGQERTWQTGCEFNPSCGDGSVRSEDPCIIPMPATQYCCKRDDTLPALQFAAPTPSNATAVSGMQAVNVSASDDGGISSITIMIDEQVVASCSSSPCVYAWNTSAYADGAHNFSAAGNDSVGNTAQTETRTVTIDNNAPAVQFTAPTPANGSVTNDAPTVNVTASDAAATPSITINFVNVTAGSRFNYACNGAVGGGQTTCVYSGTPPLAEGTYVVYAEARDLLNAAYTENRTVKVEVPPMLSYASPTPNGETIARSWIFINITSDEGLGSAWVEMNSVNYSMTVNPSDSRNAFVNVTGLSDGTYVFTSYARDLLGALANAGQRNATVDLTAPSVQFAAPTPANNTFTNAPAAISVNAVASDLDNIVLYVNGGSANVSTTSPLAYALSSEGVYSYFAQANDTHGNVNATETRVVTVDFTAPAIQFDAQTPANGTYNSSKTITVQASDAYGLNSIRLYVNGSLVASSTVSPVAYTLSGEGTYTFYAVSDDSAGNINQTEQRSVTIDFTSPTVQFVAPTPSNNSIFNSGRAVNVTADGGNLASIVLYVDGGVAASSLVSPLVYTIANEGIHSCYAVANDTAGNSNSTETRTLIIDLTAPAVQFDVQTPANGTYNSSKTITAVAGDNYGLSLIELYVNGSVVNSSSTSPVSYQLPGEGTYVFYATVNDSAGNVNQTEARSVTIDLTAPTIQFVDPTPSNATVTNSPITINVTADDGNLDTITLYVEGSPVASSATSPLTYGVSTEGVYSYYAVANDTAGNNNQTEVMVVTIDLTAPNTTANLTGALGANGWYTSNVTVTMIAQDNTSGVNNTEYDATGAWQTYAGAFEVSQEGQTTLYYRSTDNAGNTEQNNTILIKVDKTAPSYSDDAPTSWQVADFNVTINASDAVSGVASVSYNINNTGWITIPADTIIVPITNGGNYTLEYFATDNAGLNSTHVTKYVALDKDGPQLSDNAPTGWQTADFNVTINAADAESGVVSINYSINGSAPMTVLGSAATVPITAEGNYTLDYNATNGADLVSTGATKYLALDKTKPQANDDAPAGWQLAAFNVTVSASDNTSGIANVTYRLNGTTATVAGSQAIIPITSSGNWSIAYNATNRAGLVSDAKTTYAALDVNDPSASDNAPLTWQRTAFNVTINASDVGSGVASITYVFNGSAQTVSSSSVAIPMNADGNWTIAYNASDVAGRNSSNHVAYALLDTQAPSASDNAPLSWQNADFNVTINASDALSGVANVVYRVDSGNWTYASGSEANVSIANEGNHSIEYYAVDNAGNNATHNTVYAALDKTAPSITLISPADGSTIVPGTIINLDVNDSLSLGAVLYSINGSANSTLGSPYDISTANWSDGNYTIAVYANDTAGNSRTAYYSFSITTAGSLDGYVFDTSGAPVSGALVSIAGAGLNTTTGGDGYYQITPVSEGTYNITADKAGYLNQTKTAVAVSAGQTKHENFTVVKMGFVHGYVEDDSGAAISQATVIAVNAGYAAYATTNASGYYSVYVSPDTYNVTASKNASYMSQTVSGTVVGVGEDVSVDFVLTRMGAVNGTVKDAESGKDLNATVEIVYGGSVVKTVSAVNGVYDAPFLAPGLYDVRATAQCYAVTTLTNKLVSAGETTPVEFGLLYIC
jgi:hypothetical protein